jgi:hypothetical protein
MCKTNRGILALLSSVVFVSFISLQPAFAQAPQEKAPGGAPGAQAPQERAPGGAPAQKAESARGELKSVDAAKMTLTLASGETFQFNDSTKVTGAQGGAAGLATMSGRQVTIQYTTKGADRIATSIEVAAEKK